ncbi:NAD(P)H-binding protein [Saccharothrix longispora]|uniref:NAD(P)H dehydrogenase (Quinone) n=1 Tax=Saccharothrix longispora TaxID=33920 RepID=A0ABU1Q699_9PSEU|nr:NAD(P)H-binding protein [Saccharothrix longispora]MDR6597939.1 NAD(P)H dehydrogenase (quinone) [Saccharothrix longispora]
MTILITGATGHLGSLIIEHARRLAPTGEVLGSARDPRKAEHAGVEVRPGDFAGDLSSTFAGVDRLVLVSADGPNRLDLHRAAVRAAVDAGVRHVLYTSVTDADTSPLSLAADHAATERLIRASGLAFTFLRNGMYHENYLNPGPVVTAAGDGRIASASRDDLALAAAVAATTDGHEGVAYELTGPRAWSFDELAALRGTTHTKVTAEERVAGLRGFDLPDSLAELLTDIEVNIGRGALSEVRPDLEKLIGRAPTTIEDAARAAA